MDFEINRGICADRVASVALGRSPGCYIYGRAGIGKSKCAKDKMAQLGVEYIEHKGSMTGLGFFDTLQDHPDKIHLFDDMEAILSDAKGQVFVRAATESTDSAERFAPRLVKYKTKKSTEQFCFTGGLVMLGNIPPGMGHVDRAIDSRLQPIEYEISDEEAKAIIWSMAETSLIVTCPEARKEVAEFVIETCEKCGERLNPRHFEKALKERKGHDEGICSSDWRDLVRTNIRGRIERANYASKAMTDEAKLQLIIGLQAIPNDKERIKVWVERTKREVATYYRWLKKARDKGMIPPRGSQDIEPDFGADDADAA
ncbi:hypothetical protein J8F10_06495 [Gemmata sp. G18]|uniref:ATP-binding protein n=1 Tax=Gemmata palustris TaxID=2822762 RepID=A0ABS5BMH8_9BACT|nr:hypothetical protein [Gemmata palustris]MBP3954929.1 hypothetical protein [Gemmata palustris]